MVIKETNYLKGVKNYYPINLSTFFCILVIWIYL